jgi:hypothetical protein
MNSRRNITWEISKDECSHLLDSKVQQLKKNGLWREEGEMQWFIVPTWRSDKSRKISMLSGSILKAFL